MYKNKMHMMSVLISGMILLVGFSVYAELACKVEISQQEKELIAMAQSWKAMDKDLKKSKYSMDWFLAQDTKTRFEKSVESDANSTDPICGLRFEQNLLHNPKSVGIEHGIKRYREVYIESNKAKPYVYANVLSSLKCPSDDDIKLKVEYKKSQQTAINNLTYVAYRKLVQIQGEQTRNPNDLNLLAQLKLQLSILKPEVIRVSADLEFLKRAEAFADSLEAKLKSKPEVLCKMSEKLAPKISDKIYEWIQRNPKAARVL